MKRIQSGRDGITDVAAATPTKWSIRKNPNPVPGGRWRASDGREAWMFPTFDAAAAYVGRRTAAAETTTRRIG